MPWVSIFFGLMVIPAGMISILLIVLQPLLVGAWCGICLLIAVCMLVMVLLTIPEMAATVQLLLKSKKNHCFWLVFWHGSSGFAELPLEPIQRTCTSELGFTVPWNLLLTALLGVWLMCAPSIFGDLHSASDSNYVAGPLLVAISVISFSEIVRRLRFVNLAIAIGLICASFLLPGYTTYGFINTLVVGVFISLLSIPKGKMHERCGK